MIWFGQSTMNMSNQMNALSIENNTQQCSENTESISLTLDEQEITVIDQVDSWISLITDIYVVLVGGLVGVPGNVLNAVVFYRQGLRVRINLCFFSLALVDLLSLLPRIADVSETIYKKLVKSPDFIWTYSIGLNGAMQASQFLSAVIASERCFCVVSPFHAKRLLKTSTMAAIIVVCCVLLVGGTLGTIGLKFANDCKMDPKTKRMKVAGYVTEYYLKNRVIIDSIDIFLYSVGLPGIFLIVVIVATSITIVKVRAASTWRQRATIMENQPNVTGSNKDISVTLMQIVISVLFVVYVTPSLVAQVATFLVSDLSPTAGVLAQCNIVWNCVRLLTTSCSSINVVVYYKTGRKFRESVRKIFRRSRRQ